MFRAALVVLIQSESEGGECAGCGVAIGFAHVTGQLIEEGHCGACCL